MKTQKGKQEGERERFYFNLKELQIEINGSVITGALEFL